MMNEQAAITEFVKMKYTVLYEEITDKARINP